MPRSPVSPLSPPDKGIFVRARRGPRGTQLRPFRQGQLDGLCGLYAAVNALVLLFARCGTPLDPDDCYQLFRIGLDRVAPAGELAATVAEGVDRELWCDAVAAMAGHAADVAGCDVRIERPFADAAPHGAAELHGAIEAALDEGAVVLSMLCGAHYHCTVITSRSDMRFWLFDSAGLRWLAKSACGLPGSGARHRFAAEALLMVKLAACSAEDEAASTMRPPNVDTFVDTAMSTTK